MAELLVAQQRGRNQIAEANARIEAEQAIAAGRLQFCQVIGRRIYEHSREQGAGPSSEVGQGVWNTAPETEL